ncbi:PEP-CTERM sorting domain-containing protein [Sphingomonas bacterium]|uniref:PEP-CTERM sorting domain-containing protein n=1 Tax=Sphingomonas bacterium TaxID=1895847 RepID=UPI001574EEAB|nr:PEP-CTERM sorting domain-containing protein [Sphingomonas bacterium]
MRPMVRAVLATLALWSASGRAAEFLEYQITGTAQQIIGDSSGRPTEPARLVRFSGVFSVLTEPGFAFSGNNFLTSTGSIFSANMLYGSETVDGTTSGLLTYASSYAVASVGGTTNFSLLYDDADTLGGLPTRIASPLATGTLSYSTGNGFINQSFRLSGTIDSFTIIGAVPGFVQFFPTVYLPEPATWITTILGVGLIGVWLRRRQAAVREVGDSMVTA